MAGDQHWQRGSGASRDVDPMDRFLCPICLELFDDPVRVSCGHTFCMLCFEQCMTQRSPTCAVCRSRLTPGIKAYDLEKLMRETQASCKGCSSKMLLYNMRAHAVVCSQYQNYVMEGIKSVTKDQSPQAKDVPNRFTFICPYCQEQNLDQEGLVDHCKKFHFSDPTPVVCPICASMPWGDPGYRSANFMEHIHRRHRFSYDTFVDYEVDEDAMMREALVRSLKDN
ncbi:PREDICTED: E3 ubiquitin-protein ligase RNF114 [Nanorana parkeri]|uniref:E3 ubiquitin-protein ligase RNF114 n=1 Tax=Nanorana parkeri TaxID=125878 RepID=UPI0008542E16|nr:PREDICTED: E3 ubiquitin-protein ligase RNF114 [Nanorana parkeri]